MSLYQSKLNLLPYLPGQGGKAADLIWTDRETFNLYNDNFIQDIENIMQSIEEKDSVSLSDNFNKMAANCGTCHKKFRN